MSSKTIYFVAGEASGDNHGAALMRALRERCPDFEFSGRGGPQMQAVAGEAFHNWINDAAVLGLWEVIKKYGYFRQQFRKTLNEIEKQRPDAIVLIDYPGFNLRLARALRRQTASPKIIYYVSPQVWAWNRGRIKQMARWLDLMLCIFPFEAELYNLSGLRTIFVGHPMIERLSPQKTNSLREPNLIALFPGSRRREVRKIFPVTLQTMAELLRARPDLRFEVAASSSELAQEMKQMANQLIPLPTTHQPGAGFSSAMGRGTRPAGAPPDRLRVGITTWEQSRSSERMEESETIKGDGQAVSPGEESMTGPVQIGDRPQIEIKIGNAAQIMQRAFVGIIASGSATQEAAYFGLPFVLVYKVAWPTYVAARVVIRVDYLGMPNVLAKKEIVPEFVQHQAKPRAIAKAVLRLIDEPLARSEMISAFDEIVASLGKGGASDRAACAILEELRDEP